MGTVTTAYVRVPGHTGIAVEPLPQGCMVKGAEVGVTVDPEWVGFFADDRE